MTAPDVPAAELTRLRDPARMAAVRRADLLDTAGIPSLDRLAALAARVLGAPVSLVTIVGDEDVRWSGQDGLPAPHDEERGTTFSRSLCRHVVLEDGPFVRDDTRADATLAREPAVTELGVVSYAGVPVRAPDGQVLGTLCALGTSPRTWTDDDVATLNDIGEAVAAQIEARALLRERDREQAKLQTLADIGSALAMADDHEQLASTIAQRLVATMCDWCIVELAPVDPNDETGAVYAIGAPDQLQYGQIDELRRIARGLPGWRSPTLEATRDRLPIYLPDISLGDVVESGDPRDVPERLAQLVERTGMHVISAVPLLAHGTAIGALSLVRRDVVRGFDPDERRMHLEVARRLALAVDAARLREALEDRARASQVIERIGDGVVLLDDELRVSLWNPAAARITGRPARDALGRRIHEVAPELAGTMADAARGRGRLLQMDTAAGRRWLAVTGDSVGAGAVFALRDITAEHALEETRNEMVATVSHQLRTPVTSVLAAAITLQRDDIELDAATHGALVDTIVQQGTRLEELCDEVLLAYRLDSGAHHVVHRPVHLLPVLHELGRALATSHPHHPVRVAAAGGEPAPDAVLGDAHALRQVFGNLLENAVKYSPDGGPVDVDLRRDGDEVEVSVADRGIGIPAAQHDAIFERFHRLDPDMARGVGGAGLGLYVVRELVALMAGSVRVESLDPGTRMVVRLPAGAPPRRVT